MAHPRGRETLPLPLPETPSPDQRGEVVESERQTPDGRGEVQDLQGQLQVITTALRAERTLRQVVRGARVGRFGEAM